MLAAVPEGRLVTDRFGKRDFQFDLTAGSATCPAGHTVQISTSTTGFRGANFTRDMCRACPLKASCCPGRPRRQVNLTEHEDSLIAARQALADAATAKHLRRTGRGSSGCSACSPPATAPARAATSAAESAIAGRLDGGPGQPQPDPPQARRPNPLTGPHNRPTRPGNHRKPRRVRNKQNPSTAPSRRPKTLLLQRPSSGVDAHARSTRVLLPLPPRAEGMSASAGHRARRASSAAPPCPDDEFAGNPTPS